MNSPPSQPWVIDTTLPRRDEKPYVIAINSVSGGGKTALTKLVGASLPHAVVYCFDDFDDSNIYPSDFCEWKKRGSDIVEFDCPGMAAAVKAEIERGTSEFLILDYPFGRDHPRLRNQIDLSVFIDTPLDVAMIRRIQRDQNENPAFPAEEKIERLEREMAHYLDKARIVYLDTYRHKETSDLVLDGLANLDKLKDHVLDQVRVARGRNAN